MRDNSYLAANAAIAFFARKYKYCCHLKLVSTNVWTKEKKMKIETFGPWAPMGLKLIKEVGKKICDLTGGKKIIFLPLS